MSSLSEALVGQKCRPTGVGPPAKDARAEDYYYSVVACWLEPTASGFRLMCAVVGDGGGSTNVVPFLGLEFSDINWT